METILRVIGDLPVGTPVAFEAAFGWGWLVEMLDPKTDQERRVVEQLTAQLDLEFLVVLAELIEYRSSR